MIWPVFTSCIAASTDAGLTWLAEPRVSSAPHLDGHRCASVGVFQPCAAAGAEAADRITTTPIENAMRKVGLQDTITSAAEGNMEDSESR